MRKKIILSLVLAGLAVPSFAQTKSDLFKLEMGPAIPIAGDLEDVADMGLMLGGQWIHRMSPTLGLGAELSFTSYGDKAVGSVETGVDMATLMALGRFDLNSSGSKEPYFLAGLGLTETDLEVRTGSFSSSDDDTSPSFLVGGGVDIPFASMALGLEARYQHFFFDIGNVKGGGALQLLGQLRW